MCIRKWHLSTCWRRNSSPLQHQSLRQSIVTSKMWKSHFLSLMWSIDCLLCRLVQKAFLTLATMKGRIISVYVSVLPNTYAAYEILFLEVMLRCKLPPSKSTINQNIATSRIITILRASNWAKIHAGLLAAQCTLYIITHKNHLSDVWRSIQLIQLWSDSKESSHSTRSARTPLSERHNWDFVLRSIWRKHLQIKTTYYTIVI